MHYSITRFLIGHPMSLSTNLLLLSVWCLACGGPTPLTVDMPLHLEEHLDAATIVGSEVPADLPQPVEWRFDEPQPEWRPAKPIPAQWEAVEPVRADDALRLPLTAENSGYGAFFGVIYVDLPDWKLEDWGYVEIRARTKDPMRYIGLVFNYTEKDPVPGATWAPFYSPGDRALLVGDGTVQTYRLSLDWSGTRKWDGPWTHLGVFFSSPADEGAVTLDILSVRVIPREADFAGDRAGVRTDRGGTSAVSGPYRRAVYAHAPGSIAYRVRIPEEGRLDVGLGVLSDNAPVTFAITATQQDGAVEMLLEEAYTDREHWGQRSVDLSHLAGQTVTLALEAEAERTGTVALWAAPTLTGARATDKPNIIFYVIDGAGADYMSVYGYNRRNTPNLERIAEEGAVFEHAYSNSSWTRPSTASFMTSLQHSVLGGFKGGFNVVPEDAPTMAQHMHGAGYQTAVFIANSNAGRMSGLEREVDFFRETWAEFSFARGNHKESSRFMHQAFWSWREAYPGAPYWAHFQTTDVHAWVNAGPAPFAGLFISAERRETLEEWDTRVGENYGEWPEMFERAGVNRVAYAAAQRDVYDEGMAHQDYQIGRLVERLKARGEWEHTLLIVAADHSVGAANQDWGILMRDTLPSAWEVGDPRTPLFRSGVSRIPLIVVWPERISAGQRFSDPVSMIDVLTTILDLVDLPMPQVMQGQSLGPLLLGEPGWEPRPVILDEFGVEDTGELSGRIEVVDGRWGASLEINPDPEGPPERRRPTPLLLFDLWNDPMAVYPLNDESSRRSGKRTRHWQSSLRRRKASR